MKKIFTAIIAAVALLTATSAQAQIKFGLKGGLNVTNMSFSTDELISNKTGFFVGPAIKVGIPLVGLGVDAALLYDQREAEVEDGPSLKQRSINIPINLRYNIGFSSIVGAYIAAGPQFGFGIGDKSTTLYDDADGKAVYDISNSNFSVNVGAGVTLLSHLEIGFTYNIACGKTGEVNAWDVDSNTWNQVTKGRANAWQVSAAYWF